MEFYFFIQIMQAALKSKVNLELFGNSNTNELGISEENNNISEFESTGRVSIVTDWILIIHVIYLKMKFLFKTFN